ncbi:MAG: CRTAC1 family protein [Byssovorax sp.]
MLVGSLFTLGAIHCGGDASTSSTGTGGSSSTTTGSTTGSTTGTGGTGGQGGDPEPMNPLPPAICHAGGTKWKAGTPAFKESTAAWKLDTIGVYGTRLDAVDFDGDGWADLIVRKGGITPDNFADPMGRQTWLLRNKHDGTFEDVTIASGFRKNRTVMDPNLGRPGEVVAFGDVDNDGDLDAYTGLTNDKAKPQVETSELMINNGDGTFSLGPEASALRAKPPIYDVPAGASFIDFDRDGLLDIWVTQNSSNGIPQQDRLYKGDGKGGFTDVTVLQGLKTKAWSYSSSGIDALNKGLAHSNAWSAAACDLNNDGNAELLAASYGRAPNHLWQSKGSSASFQFENRGVVSGYAFDDNQNWSDNESARCWCKLHPTDQDCDGVPPPMYIPCATDADAFRWDHQYDRNAFRLGGNSGTTLCADLDNDGNIDLVTSEIAHWDVGQSSDKAEIMLNTGEADVHFTRPGIKETGLTRDHINGWNEGIMTSSAFDFDNDGWLDLYLGNSDYPGNYGLLYHQVSPGHFEAVPTADGIDHHRSHGSAVADFDHDGDLDIVVGHSRARCGEPVDCYPTQQVRFFENVIGQGGNSVELTLTGGPNTNRAAIGARVTLTAGGVTQTREVEGGHGHYGMQDDLTVHFGLGEACEAIVTVRWPDATLTTQKFKLVAGYRYTVTQGQDPVAVIPPNP